MISSGEKMKSSFPDALKAERRKRNIYDWASKGLRMILPGTGQWPPAPLWYIISAAPTAMNDSGTAMSGVRLS